MRRMVYIPSENIMGEILQEQLHGALIKYYLGGFEYVEFFSDEDYEYLDDFEYYVEDDE